MNYGYSDSPLYSGEKWVINNVIKGKADPKNNKINIINVGANNGQYCDLLIDLIGPSFQEYNIYLFEPQEECIALLKKKYRNFGNIHIHGIGLGEKKETKVLYREKQGSVQASMIKNPLLKNEFETTITISTLDYFCRDNSIDNIHCLVIDVEGYEMNVLRGAGYMLKNKSIGIIQFEHGSINSIKNKKYLIDFFDILLDYKIYHIKQDGLIKIDYKPEFEIFYNTNYLALLKG